MTMTRWRRSQAGPFSQQGQALTEFLVASLVVVPLFLLIPMIGKYQDMAHNTLMASRYVAFGPLKRAMEARFPEFFELGFSLR